MILSPTLFLDAFRSSFSPAVGIQPCSFLFSFMLIVAQFIDSLTNNQTLFRHSSNILNAKRECENQPTVIIEEGQWLCKEIGGVGSKPLWG